MECRSSGTQCGDSLGLPPGRPRITRTQAKPLAPAPSGLRVAAGCGRYGRRRTQSSTAGKLLCREIGVRHDALIGACRDDPAARGRVHGREIRKLGGVRGVGEVRQQVRREGVAEGRPLLGGERLEIRLQEAPGKIGMLARRGDLRDQRADEARRQLVGQRDRERLPREIRIERARGGRIVAHPFVRIGGHAGEREHGVVGRAIGVRRRTRSVCMVWRAESRGASASVRAS